MKHCLPSSALDWLGLPSNRGSVHKLSSYDFNPPLCLKSCISLFRYSDVPFLFRFAVSFLISNENIFRSLYNYYLAITILKNFAGFRQWEPWCFLLACVHPVWIWLHILSSVLLFVFRIVFTEEAGIITLFGEQTAV